MTAEVTALASAATAAGDGCPILLAFGAPRSSTPALVNAALSSSLPPEEQVSSIAPPGKSLSSDLVTAPLVAAPVPGDVPALVLNVRGLDSRDRTLAAAFDAALVSALAVAGVVLLSVRLQDLPRPSSSGINALVTALEKNLAQRANSIALTNPSRRWLVVVVRDYEPEEVTLEELESNILDHLERAYAGIEKPTLYSSAAICDLFNVEIRALPSEKAAQVDFEEGVFQLGESLRSSSKDYADASVTSEKIVSIVDHASAKSRNDVNVSLPADRELAASFACDEVMRTVHDKYRETTGQWKNTVDAGRIIRDFGSESSNLISKTIDVYTNDAAAYKETLAFARKREELKSNLLADAYALFAKQILKLREVVYQRFRNNLGRIRINDRVEKNIKGTVFESEQFFIDKATSLRCPLGNWRFDNERHELVNHMREDATERLQLARLQGNYVPPIRAPIAFAFHTLLLAPFGQDSRTVNPHAEEMNQKYDPDKAKKAGIMRSRPHQQGHMSYKLGSRHEVSSEAMSMFDEHFVDTD